MIAAHYLLKTRLIIPFFPQSFLSFSQIFMAAVSAVFAFLLLSFFVQVTAQTLLQQKYFDFIVFSFIIEKHIF